MAQWDPLKKVSSLIEGYKPTAWTVRRASAVVALGPLSIRRDDVRASAVVRKARPTQQ